MSIRTVVRLDDMSNRSEGPRHLGINNHDDHFLCYAPWERTATFAVSGGLGGSFGWTWTRSYQLEPANASRAFDSTIQILGRLPVASSHLATPWAGCLVSLGQCPQHQMTRNLEALSSELLLPQEGRSAGLLLELIEFLRWCKGLTLQIVLLSPTLLQNQIKSNQITFIVTSPQHKCLGEWNSYERAPDSAEKQQTIYLWTDSAKKNNNRQFTYGQTVQKTALEHLQCSRQCKKNNSNLHMDRQCKKATAIYIWTVHIYRLYRRQCAKYTYIYSVHIVYYKDIMSGCWRAAGGLNWNWILWRESGFCNSGAISAMASLSSLSPPLKFVPWSDHSSAGVPLPAINRLRAIRKESEFMLLRRSKCTALVVKHLKMIPQRFSVRLPILISIGTKQSTPHEWKAGLWRRRRAEGKSAILGIVGCALQRWHSEHLCWWRRMTSRPRIIQ